MPGCRRGFLPAFAWVGVGRSGDTGVVKHVERQRDDGFKPVVFDDQAADVALTLSGVPREQRTAVVDLGNAAAQPGILLHLAHHIGKEQHLPVTGAGDQAQWYGDTCLIKTVCMLPFLNLEGIFIWT